MPKIQINVETVGKIAMGALQLFGKLLAGGGKKDIFGAAVGAGVSLVEAIAKGKTITEKHIAEVARAFEKMGGTRTGGTLEEHSVGALDLAANALVDFKSCQSASAGADFHLDQAAAHIRAMANHASVAASEFWAVRDWWGKTKPVASPS